MSRIGVRLAAVSVTLLLMLASLALYSSIEGRITLVEGVGLASEAIAESLSNSLDKVVYMRSHEVLTVMDDSVIITEVSDSNTAYDAMENPEEYIDLVDQEWTSASLDVVPESMQEILDSNISLMLRSRFIEHYLSAHGMEIFGEVILTNKYGAVVASTGRTTDFRQSDEAWWLSAQEGEFTITDVSYDESSDIYGVFACMPIRDSDGGAIGVAKAVVNILTVAKEVELTALGYETSELKIATSDGRLMFSSRAYSILQNLSADEFFMQVSGARGHFLEKEGGTDRLFSFATSSGYLEYEGHGWIIILSHAEAEVLGPATALETRILVVAILAIVFAAVMTVALSRSITYPLRELEEATRSMAKGELGKRIAVTRKDELGKLANSFNYMASELESLYSDLDQRVNERTAELEDVNKKLAVLASITRHDAMNQMTVQKGLLYMARGSSKDPVVNDYLRKLEVLTSNLEDFFRFTSEYEEVGVKEPEWVNVREAFAAAVVGLDLTGTELMLVLDGVEVFADPMFPKVLHNLVGNSLTHGQTTTRISVSYSEDGDGLTMVIEDNGVGIKAEQKDSIFQRERVAGRRTHGLFLSAEILRISKISIRENGIPGKGARFEIFIPKGRYRFVDEPHEGSPPGL
jgi:signal transduction histidine kinase